MIHVRAATDDSTRRMSSTDSFIISSQERTSRTADSTISLITEPSCSSSPSQHFVCTSVDPTTPLNSIQCMELSSDLLSLQVLPDDGEDDSERDATFEKRKKNTEARNSLVVMISDAIVVGALSCESSGVPSSNTDSDIDSMNESLDIEVGEQQAPTIGPLSSQTRPILKKTKDSQDTTLIQVNPLPQFTMASGCRSAFENSSREGVNEKMTASPPKRPERRTSYSSQSIEEALSLSGLMDDMDSETDDDGDIVPNPQSRSSQHPLAHEQLPARASAEDDHQTKQDVMPMLPRRIVSRDGSYGSEIISNQKTGNGSASEVCKGESCLSWNSDPSRRILDTHIEYCSSRSHMSGSSSETSKAIPLSVSHIEKYVTERIPNSVKAKFPPDAWQRIFRTAIESAQQKAEHPASLLPGDVSVSKLDKLKGGIIVDGLPSGEHLPAEDDDRSAAVSPRATVPSPPLPPSTPRRSWGAGDLREDSLIIPARRAVSPWQDSVNASASDLILRDSEVASKLLLKRGVSFDSVHVRHYAQILVESPCCSSGPAVGLGWNFEVLPSMTLDEAASIPRRRTSSMLLSRHEREAIVRGLGYSQKQIAAAIRRSLKAKHQRRQTILHLSNQNLEEVVEEIVEKSRRKVKRILRFGSKEKIVSNTTQSKEQWAQ
jgi:hypothetical protein